ncbi:spermine/spermidine synthase domain-containing protein [Schlesneria paludicola]|uniref:spermine/spermidine synthase domain-containing protein n=1 Tax=Schlesneria paludicola TaxID=360056 RepID=UPI00029B1725|nr:spermidine synthase [Schlesneria paludicola]
MESKDQWIGEELTPHDVWQHRVTKVLTSCQTPFQTLAVVDSGVYGRALVLDNRWQTCTGDEFLYHEPIVHTPLVLHGNPRRVLIAGGADGGAAREALKWKTVEEIRLVDIDGAAVEACRTWLPEIHQGSLNHSRVHVEIGDAYDVIAQARDWDVIIADLTDPIEDGPAYKLFTREFFTHCRQALRPGGLFVNQAGSMSPPLLTPLSRTAKTIESVFAHTAVMSVFVPTYGSPWGMVLASDTPINTSPAIDAIDAHLAQSVNGPLRMFDGRTLLGLLQPPRHVRERIADETMIYSLDNPPQLSRGNA